MQRRDPQQRELLLGHTVVPGLGLGSARRRAGRRRSRAAGHLLDPRDEGETCHAPLLSGVRVHADRVEPPRSCPLVRSTGQHGLHVVDRERQVPLVHAQVAPGALPPLHGPRIEFRQPCIERVEERVPLDALVCQVDPHRPALLGPYTRRDQHQRQQQRPARAHGDHPCRSDEGNRSVGSEMGRCSPRKRMRTGRSTARGWKRVVWKSRTLPSTLSSEEVGNA